MKKVIYHQIRSSICAGSLSEENYEGTQTLCTPLSPPHPFFPSHEHNTATITASFCSKYREQKRTRSACSSLPFFYCFPFLFSLSFGMTKDTDAATAGSSDSSGSRPPPLNTTVHNALSSPSSAPLGRASKSLSPAVSAFQFKPVHHTLSPCRSLEMTSSQRSLSSEGVQSASPSSRDLRRSQSNHAMRAAAASSSSSLSTSPRVQTVIQDGYVYKDEVIILDKEKKEELLKVGEITLQSEWTFWYDR